VILSISPTRLCIVLKFDGSGLLEQTWAVRMEPPVRTYLEPTGSDVILTQINQVILIHP
jgi:hypothetical protein